MNLTLVLGYFEQWPPDSLWPLNLYLIVLFTESCSQVRNTVNSCLQKQVCLRTVRLNLQGGRGDVECVHSSSALKIQRGYHGNRVRGFSVTVTMLKRRKQQQHTGNYCSTCSTCNNYSTCSTCSTLFFSSHTKLQLKTSSS